MLFTSDVNSAIKIINTIKVSFKSAFMCIYVFICINAVGKLINASYEYKNLCIRILMIV